MKISGVVVVLTLATSFSSARAESIDCEPARCAVQAAIAAECVCETASNHGRYVSCVAHVVRRLASVGTIPVTCKGKVTRCAAKSVCGKAGFVTCQIPTDTCDLATFTCAENPTLTCATDLDCGASCKIKRSQDACFARGGTVGTASSCCADCNL